VTLQTIDLAERIEVLTSSLDRLRDLLDQATTTSELIELETAITARHAERDSLVSQQNYLSDQIQFASISIELRTEQEAPPRQPSGFGDAVIAGWFALVAFAGSSLIFLGMSLPWLALVAIILVPVVWLGRRRRARRLQK
jgi:Flp pilus assembly protein TadB